jgi:hypothetical protein
MHMSFDWTEFLALAEALQFAPDSWGSPEATLRSAASRAYYAAFHCALNFARSDGFVPSYSGDDHKKIQAYFRNYEPPDPTRKKIALDLHRLLNHRHDVNILSRQPVSLACQAIGMAKSALKNLDSLA